jgi:hypothetical protein
MRQKSSFGIERPSIYATLCASLSHNEKQGELPLPSNSHRWLLAYKKYRSCFQTASCCISC